MSSAIPAAQMQPENYSMQKKPNNNENFKLYNANIIVNLSYKNGWVFPVHFGKVPCLFGFSASVYHYLKIVVNTLN